MWKVYVKLIICYSFLVYFIVTIYLEGYRFIRVYARLGGAATI